MILDPTAIGLTLASGAVVGLLLAVFGGGGSVLAEGVSCATRPPA